MNTSELIWKYLDGACSPEEEGEVERLLAEDAAFKEEWARSRKLHESLKHQPLEQPSMRFARNIMERLPALYRKINIRPLFTPMQWRVIYGLLGAFLLGYSYLTFSFLESGAPGPGSRALESLANTLNSLPYQVMAVVAALSFGFITLAWLDRALKRRFR